MFLDLRGAGGRYLRSDPCPEKGIARQNRAGVLQVLPVGGYHPQPELRCAAGRHGIEGQVFPWCPVVSDDRAKLFPGYAVKRSGVRVESGVG